MRASVLALTLLTACPVPTEPEPEPTPAVPAGVPFVPGASGTSPFSIAGDFDLDTTDGRWRLSEQWTGFDSYLFLQKTGSSGYTADLWASDAAEFLEAAPDSVHVFFLSTSGDAEGEVLVMRDRMQAALGDVDDPERWTGRLHYVTEAVNDLNNDLEEILETWPVNWGANTAGFGIDHFQQLRELGLLRWPSSGTSPELRYAANEPLAWDHEYERELRVRAMVEHAVFPLTAVGSDFYEVELPGADELARWNHMEIELRMECTDRTDANCPEWDTGVALWVCSPDEPDSCPDELARWITTYHREGAWQHDVSPLMAFVSAGGLARFHLDGPGGYDYSFALHFSQEEGADGSPQQIERLWRGGSFGSAYNGGQEPITFEVPDGTTRVQLYAIITGHGWGVEQANCAEFCNHTHHFAIGEDEWVKTHELAGTQFGCQQQIDRGVVPNQFGTWPLGRAGWCPGQHVEPFIADITQAVQPGENVLTYRALVGGVDYVPQPASNPNPGGFGAQIDLSSYLIFWQ